MTEAAQYMFDRKQILEMLIRAQGVKTGHWSIAVEFNFAATAVGPTPELALPSAIVGVGKIGIQKADPSDPTAVDAALVSR